jgi:predicted nucleotidyltransferase
MEGFLHKLKQLDTEEQILDFCRKSVLHGTPWILKGRDDDYYDFRNRIATKFNISFHEIYITGSAKLGFSPYKKTEFSYESDVDVAIVSSQLFDEIMESIRGYQMKLRESRLAVSEWEIKKYHKFLEYGAIGWMRPDHLPHSFLVKKLKDDWFDFFASISYGKTEIGNYKVNAGVFKTYQYLEHYTLSSIKSLKTALSVEAHYEA